MRQLKYKLTDGNPTEQGNSSINSAENNLSAIVSSLLELPGPLDHLQTENHLNEIIITSNVESFDRQVEQPIQSTVHTTSLILPVINQFDQCKFLCRIKNKQLIQYSDSNDIDKNIHVNTPWGSRKIIYADYTTSGRGLLFIE
ncbi:unnamed protein product [Rotaria socialis]|uniref:Uncharacterized protein n=1 Tax=Rotaria socialis TaxID=392032 RepID=A0A821MWI0_9BILA|nr:unnamed protein product [Rotaria socialis]